MKALDGAELLEKELKRRGLSRKQARAELDAVGCKVSHTAFQFWLDRKSRPVGVKAEVLEAWSGGRIPRGSWLSAHERDSLKAAKKAGGKAA